MRDWHLGVRHLILLSGVLEGSPAQLAQMMSTASLSACRASATVRRGPPMPAIA
jgi:hypothetical protein